MLYKKKKILFVSYGGGHINLILPVVEKCKNEGYPLDIMALTGAKIITDSLGIKTLGFKDFIEEKNREKIKYFGKKILSENYDTESGIDKEESIYYLGINWLENLERYGEETTERIYLKVKRHSFLPIKFFERIIKEYKYELVVTTNSPKSERAAIIAANNLKIKSIRIEDLFFDDDLQLDLINKLGTDYSKSIGKFKAAPTKIFVMSEYTKSIYKKNKNTMLLETPESDVIVTGQPIFDRLLNKKLDPIENENKVFKQRNEFILWCHSNETLDESEVYGLICNWLKNYSTEKFNLAIKLHPHFTLKHKRYIENLFSKFSRNYFFVDEKVSLEDAIKKCKVLIAQESTTMLEAFFLKKRSICLDPTNIRKEIHYVKCGICPRVINDQELNEMIYLKSDKDHNQFEEINKKMGFNINATETIFYEISKLI